MIAFKMIKFCKAYIPLGMYRSVERNAPLQSLHPVKDASLTGCRNSGGLFFLPSPQAINRRPKTSNWETTS
jgi:hypothetical protein